MATTVLSNGNVTFGDGTSLSSANIPYSNVTNPKTALSQFTNNLGNYGNFMTAGSINTSAIDTGAFPHMKLNYSGTTLSLVTDNCNCNCNCNC